MNAQARTATDTRPALHTIRVHFDGLALSPDMAVADYEADTRFTETVEFTALAFEADVHGITVDMHDSSGNVLASHTFA